MADTITIQLEGIPGLRAAFERAAGKLARPGPLMQAIAAQLEVNVNRRFDTKTAPDGSRWAPWAASTRRAYAKRDKGKRQGSLLEGPGRDMRNSLTSHGDDEMAEVGFSRDVNGWPLALLHEMGTRRMPRRQLLTDDSVTGTLGRGDVDDIEHLVQDYLEGLF